MTSPRRGRKKRGAGFIFARGVTLMLGRPRKGAACSVPRARGGMGSLLLRKGAGEGAGVSS